MARARVHAPCTISVEQLASVPSAPKEILSTMDQQIAHTQCQHFLRAGADADRLRDGCGYYYADQHIPGHAPNIPRLWCQWLH